MSTPRALAAVPELAEYIGTSPRNVRHLIATRTVPFIRIGSKIRFDLDDIDAWLAENRVPVGGTEG